MTPGPAWKARRTAVVVAVTAALALPASGRAQEAPSPAWSYDHDVHVTYEFDDNVREELSDPVRAQVAKVAYRGDLGWGGGTQRLTVSYQGGFKRHFGLVSDELDVSNQLVNEGAVAYTRRVGDNLALRGRVGLKDRLWTDDDFFFINEDAFRRYSGAVEAIVNLAPLSDDGAARLEIGGRYSDTEFRNLDQSFGNWLVGGHVGLAKEYDGNLEARWTYSFDRVRFPGRGIFMGGDDVPENILRGVTRPRQEDRVHELGTEVRWYGPVGIAADYRFRYNDSNSFGFTWFSHNVGLQLLRQLPWGVLVQAYGQVELRSFTEPVPSFPGGSLDTGDAEDNVLLLRLVKDMTRDYAVEVRYARYRNESLTLNDFYTKNIYAVGIIYRP